MARSKIGEMFGVAFGAVIIAFGVAGFLVPGKIVGGGASGAAIIIHFLFGLPVGLTVFLLNVPLFLLGLRSLGRGFFLRALLGMVVSSAAIDLFALILPPLTTTPILAAIYGGATVGLGVGVVIYFRGSTGGTDLAAQLIRKYFGVSVGKAIFVMDALIISAGAGLVGLESALYGLISLVVLSRTVDFVQEGIHRARAVFIISEHPREVAGKILTEMDRGVTGWQGVGMYTNAPREILLCVVLRKEVFQLKQLVKEIDPRAFVLVTDAYEVLGRGFSMGKTNHEGRGSLSKLEGGNSSGKYGKDAI